MYPMSSFFILESFEFVATQFFMNLYPYKPYLEIIIPNKIINIQVQSLSVYTGILNVQENPQNNILWKNKKVDNPKNFLNPFSKSCSPFDIYQ